MRYEYIPNFIKSIHCLYCKTNIIVGGGGGVRVLWNEYFYKNNQHRFFSNRRITFSTRESTARVMHALTIVLSVWMCRCTLIKVVPCTDIKDIVVGSRTCPEWPQRFEAMKQSRITLACWYKKKKKIQCEIWNTVLFTKIVVLFSIIFFFLSNFKWINEGQ